MQTKFQGEITHFKMTMKLSASLKDKNNLHIVPVAPIWLSSPTEGCFENNHVWLKNVWTSDKSWEPDHSLTVSNSVIHSLLSYWTTFVFMSMLKSHSHEIKSCSACGEWVNDRVIEWDIERVREWLLSIDMKTKVVQHVPRNQTWQLDNL